MLISVLKDIWNVARAKAPTAPPRRSERSEASSPSGNLAPGWRVYGDAKALQQQFHVAVVMPTVGRPSLREAVQSIYDQAFPGRIQLLIGVDAPLGSFDEHEGLFASAPSNVTVCFYYPGYSTSVRHGGLHPARDGGVLRAILTYMANARYIAYLDDDNWWNPLHLQSLLVSIEGRSWAHADRWFVHQDTRQVLGADDWESVGPGRGIFAGCFGGWVDPNCLMFDKLACEPAIRLWTIPLPGDVKAMSADRHIYAFMQEHGTPAVTGLITTYYALQADDGMHPYRLHMLEAQAQTMAGRERIESSNASGIQFSFLLPTRNRITGLSALLESIKATTARPDELEIILGIDEDDQPTRDFVWDGLNVVKVIVPPKLTMGRLNQACYKAARGRYLMAMNDDVLLRTPGWDDKIRQALDAVRDDIILVHVNDMLFGQQLCCFPMVSRTFCEMAGGFCPDEYERYRIDDHIHETFGLLGAHGHHRVLYMPNIVFEHLNYVPGHKDQRLYQLNPEILRRDAQRFDASSSDRKALAERLAHHIDAARERRMSTTEDAVRRMLGSKGA
jgi:glycosyltransferase involved in cell wall biosynthesis